MITDDEVMRLFERADPARADDTPAVADPAVYLTALRSRSSNVTLIDTEPTRTQPPNRHRWPIIAAAAAFVAVAGGLVLVYLVADDDSSESDVPTGPPSTVIADDVATDEATDAEQIARAFIETRWSDPDHALSYVSDGVTCTPESRCLPSTGHPALPTPAETSRTAERLRLEAELFEAIGDKIVNVRCEQQDTTASGITVRCTYDYHTFRSEELGRGPFEQGPDDFVVRDRKIVSISPFLRFGLGLQFGEIWEDFRVWLSIQHPDDAALMYEGETPDQPLHGIDGWLFSEQSIALWERYTVEYAADRTQVGIMGLPPEDAVPSTPENGELVVRLWTHSPTAPRMRIFVYADGRLITQREGWSASGPLEGAMERHTSYLEQRLTPEGVELLWDYALSSGLFEADGEVVLNVGNVAVGTCPPTLQVGNGDHLVSVSCTDGQGGNGGASPEEATPEQLGWLVRLQERLVDPARWLPPSAWEHYAPTPYVASRYMVCLWGAETSVLPEAAAAVLTEGTPTTHPHDPDNASCTALTTAQTRSLAAALDDAGTPRDPNLRAELGYELVDAAGNRAGVMFTPYLPHGEAPCISCG